MTARSHLIIGHTIQIKINSHLKISFWFERFLTEERVLKFLWALEATNIPIRKLLSNLTNTLLVVIHNRKGIGVWKM